MVVRLMLTQLTPTAFLAFEAVLTEGLAGTVRRRGTVQAGIETIYLDHTSGQHVCDAIIL